MPASATRAPRRSQGSLATATTTKLLLDHGADILVRQAEAFAPLHDAAQQGRKDLVALLLERGAEAASRADDGTTARDIALKAHDDVAALLK